MKGERKSQLMAALLAQRLEKILKPDPIPPMESPMQPGWAFRRQAH
jgi:hypothetical protein